MNGEGGGSAFTACVVCFNCFIVYAVISLHCFTPLFICIYLWLFSVCVLVRLVFCLCDVLFAPVLTRSIPPSLNGSLPNHVRVGWSQLYSTSDAVDCFRCASFLCFWDGGVFFRWRVPNIRSSFLWNVLHWWIYMRIYDSVVNLYRILVWSVYGIVARSDQYATFGTIEARTTCTDGCDVGDALYVFTGPVRSCRCLNVLLCGCAACCFWLYVVSTCLALVK